VADILHTVKAGYQKDMDVVFRLEDLHMNGYDYSFMGRKNPYEPEDHGYLNTQFTHYKFVYGKLTGINRDYGDSSHCTITIHQYEAETIKI